MAAKKAVKPDVKVKGAAVLAAVKSLNAAISEFEPLIGDNLGLQIALTSARAAIAVLALRVK